MAHEHFFPSPAEFSSGLGSVPFFGSSYAPPGLDAQSAMQGFGMMAWADDLQLPADSSAAHFDSALSSLVSSPAHNATGDDVAIGDLIGRLGSICNAAAAAAGSASNSCYSTPLSSPPRGASSPAAAFRGYYHGGAAALEAGTGRLSRVASSKSLGAAATPPGLESPIKMGMGGGTEMRGPVTAPAAAKGDGGAARKRKASSSAAMAAAAATNASPKRSKVAAAGGGASNKDDEDTDAAAEEEKPELEPEPAKDYIHVRARRGQATDSHSLAERVRRERISERMKMLQSLVPGCNKITGKALMLDEIINYVQSLQRQVEFLSMKLATMNPELMEVDTQYQQQLPAASKDDTMHQAGAMAATATLAYPTAAAALSPYAAADPFFAAHPTPQLDYSCTASSLHPGWEAQDLQTMLRHHSTAVADGMYASAAPPQPHHHNDNSFHGRRQQQQQSHMKLEQP